MKKIFFLVMLFVATFTFAQTTTTNATVEEYPGGMWIYFAPALDSAETEWSQAFGCSNFDDDLTASAHPYQYSYDAATADSVNTSIYWFVSFDNTNWIVADTIATATSATATKGTFNNNAVKALFNKIKVVNNAGSKANTSFKVGIYLPNKDN